MRVLIVCDGFQMHLWHAFLLDDATRRHFYIASITIGPKRSQKIQKIDEECQEWLNPYFASGQTNSEKVYRIKVCIYFIMT